MSVTKGLDVAQYTGPPLTPEDVPQKVRPSGRKDVWSFPGLSTTSSVRVPELEVGLRPSHFSLGRSHSQGVLIHKIDVLRRKQGFVKTITTRVEE